MKILAAQDPNLDSHDLPVTKQQRLVFIGGVYSKARSKTGNLPPGATLEISADGSALLLSIPDKAVVEDIFHIVFLPNDDGGAKKPLSVAASVRILAGASTRLKVVVDELNPPDTAYESGNVFETRMAPGACVNFYQIRRGGKGVSDSKFRFYLKRHSDLDFFSFIHGGDITRNEIDVHFEEEHGFCSLKGLAVLDDASQAFNRITAHHAVGRCISRQFYKNVLSGRSKSGFDSFVRVLPGASKSDSNQLCKNILLSDSAEASVRPQLKIETDDVVCVHGATVGRLEKDELFYLTSRGLSKEYAQFLLTYGFAEEVLEGVEPAPLREQLETLVRDELSKTLPLRGTQ